jgi:hexosaminidase
MKSLPDLLLVPRPRVIRPAAGTCAPDAPVRTVTESGRPEQGYALRIAPEGITVAARDEAGFFYARQTLDQLRRQAGAPLPCGEIEDHPDFAHRGVMLDISRDRVPTMARLFALVDQLAALKINHLELYTEHTFAYANHREVWAQASPMTAAEIRELDAYCRARHIELVPNQNSFGHLQRWLKHPRYRDLAECPDGHEAWGAWRAYPFSLNPLDPRSLALLDELFAELLPNFTSRRFNVGCDETVDLGQGRSKDACATRGKGRVYLDFLQQVHARVTQHGRTMHFWGDIILHHPELIPELPRDAVALVWGYEANHPFESECAAFAQSGLPFWVCPGTSTWNSMAGRTENMRENIARAARQGLQHGARGLLVTDWGDNGHWQPPVASWPGFVWGAALAWCGSSNRDLPLARALDEHILHDPAGRTGAALLALGDVYRLVGPPAAQRQHGLPRPAPG